MRIVKLLMLLTAMASLGGCYYQEVRPVRPYCPYGSFWVGGFRDPAGYWHPGHWQCR